MVDDQLAAMLRALSESGPAQMLRTSFVVYPVVNALHVAAIGGLFSMVALLDAKILVPGWRGGRGLDERVLRHIALICMGIAVSTGFALFSVQPVDYAVNPAFRTKLVLLALALANAGILFLTSNRASPGRQRLQAAVSLAAWIGVLMAGRFIGFV